MTGHPMIDSAVWNGMGPEFQAEVLNVIADPPPAQLFSSDPGNGNPGKPWISVDSAGNLYIYGNQITSTTVSPSGDTTGITDTGAIQSRLNQGNIAVLLAKGTFYLSAPLTIPPYCALVGQFNSTQVSQTDGGTVLKAGTSYAALTITDGGSVTISAAIAILGQTFGGYSTTSEEQKIRNIMIDGTGAPSGFQGIMSYGQVSRVVLSEVLVSKVTGDGVQQNLDVAGNQPDAWNGYKVFCRYGTGKGFVLRSADSTWVNCLTSNNGDTGVDWFINTTSNSKYIGCRSEHAAGVGFGYVCTNSSNSSGGIAFIGCSTDQSALHGFQLGGTLNSIASFVHATPILLSGCVLRRDGQNAGAGGNYAGIYVNGYGATSGGLVTISGCQTWPGVNDNGSGALTPKYGIWVTGGSSVAIGGGTSACAATGGTAVFNDSSGGANSILYDNSVSTGVGATATMSINTAPALAAYQGVSVSLTPAAAPATDPLSIVNQNSGERAFGMSVSGDTADRVKWTSDGILNLGPGNATQDTFLKRTAVGVLAADNGTDFAVDTQGHGLRVKEGGNGKQGTAQLSSGTVVVANTSVTATSRIFLTIQNPANPGAIWVSARSAGTSFTVTSSSGTDGSTFAYEIFEPA